MQYYLAEYPALPCVIPLHSLNDYALLKKFQSVALKRQQTTGMYFVTLLFLPILKPGSAWPCPGGASLLGW